MLLPLQSIWQRTSSRWRWLMPTLARARAAPAHALSVRALLRQPQRRPRDHGSLRLGAPLGPGVRRPRHRGDPAAAHYVRAYVRRSKTDAADALALLEAARCADIVAVKSQVGRAAEPAGAASHALAVDGHAHLAHQRAARLLPGTRDARAGGRAHRPGSHGSSGGRRSIADSDAAAPGHAAAARRDPGAGDAHRPARASAGAARARICRPASC